MFRPRFWLLLALVAALANLSGFAAEPATQPASQEPSPPKRVAFVGEQKSVELEVIRSDSGHLLVRPNVNGKEAGWWFLDTGAGINCIDTALAEQLGLVVLREGTATGMGGNANTKYRAIDTLTLGPALLEGSEAIELDLTGFEKHLGHKISGIIGYDTFFAAVFEIDHRGGKVSVHNPKTYELKDAEWMPIQLLDRRPSVEGRIEGHPAGLLMIDSGSNTGAIVMSHTVKAFDLLNNRKLKSATSGGVGGMMKNPAGVLDEITLGHTHLKHVDTIFSQADTGGTANPRYQAILGIPTLKPFVVIVNYPQMKLALKPHGAP